ncbi:three-helix bundle dimerization domain-containing protein [Streptomyces bobili]|uniref:three-helix bundle dimerization domain-containing protein n=1 Tax=Streptomyces bobili TaxID=67280 RepID=UPI0036473164
MISLPRATTDGPIVPGSHCPDTRPVGLLTPAAEQRALQDVQARLARRFPDTPPKAVASAAAAAFDYFADARVRHYVPVLAFKRASWRLSGRPDAPGVRGGDT